MIYFLVILVLLVLGGYLFFQHPRFGGQPDVAMLKRFEQSPYYSNGKFNNLNHTPTFTKGYNFGKVLFNYLFVKHPRRRPTGPVPSVKTDLHKISREENLLVWFGHSSYYLQVDGLRFLVDPVFSGNASPLRGSNRSFPGSDIYQPEDIPDVDYLLITHDHYDHLDYKTVLALKPKVKQVVTGLGVGAHLKRWGYSSEIITELDWNEELALKNNIVLHATPARHFSGRGFKRNVTLWLSFVLLSPNFRIYIGGDSGYDDHFKSIGRKFGPFHLALLDNGQYNPAWRAIHMFPEDVVQAAADLRAQAILPGHSGKFMMSTHEWDEPLRKVCELADGCALPLVTPRIGEPVYLSEAGQKFEHWWMANK